MMGTIIALAYLAVGVVVGLWFAEQRFRRTSDASRDSDYTMDFIFSAILWPLVIWGKP